MESVGTHLSDGLFAERDVVGADSHPLQDGARVRLHDDTVQDTDTQVTEVTLGHTR